MKTWLITMLVAVMVAGSSAMAACPKEGGCKKDDGACQKENKDKGCNKDNKEACGGEKACDKENTGCPKKA